MGVSTKAIIRKGVTIEQIENAISEKYESVKVTSNNYNDVFYVNFMYDGIFRTLAVIFDYDVIERDCGISGTWLCLNYWGSSVDIMKYLCETFGGYIDENDCDADDFYPINEKLFLEGTDLTKLDLLKHKLIHVVGYEKLGSVMSLLHEYENQTSVRYKFSFKDARGVMCHKIIEVDERDNDLAIFKFEKENPDITWRSFVVLGQVESVTTVYRKNKSK